MKKSYSKSSRQGLPGGPNEMFQKVKGIIVSERGQWDFPGMTTLVPTDDGRITMRGVPYPVLGQDETGYTQMMYPGGEYKFRGKNVLELPMAQNGVDKTKLQPWEYLDEEGNLHTDTDKLPFDPMGRQKYAEELNWMGNWISKRRPQMQSAIQSYYDKKDEKYPIDAFLKKYITSPLFGKPYSYYLTNDWNITDEQLGKTILHNAQNNLKKLRFKDSSKISPGSYVPPAWGSYTPDEHHIYFYGEDPSDETKIHEIGHGTRLGSQKIFTSLIEDIIKNDELYKTKYDSYYHSPEEVYSRIWELRKGLDLKPTDKITKKNLKEKIQKINSDDALDIFRHLKVDTIIKLLNDLVYQEPASELPMAQRGGALPKFQNAGTKYVDPNDFRGRARYKAYKDSLDLYNRYVDFKNVLLSNPITSQQVARRYNIQDLRDGMFSLEGVGRPQVARNSNNVNPNIKPIAGWSYQDPYQSAGDSEFLAEYKKPVERVKYKLDQEIVEKQKLLKEAGLYKGKIDGIWGTASQKAWDNYQKQFNVAPAPTNQSDQFSKLNRNFAKQYIDQMQFRNPISGETEERFRLITPEHEYIMNMDQYGKLLPTDSVPQHGNFLYRTNRKPVYNLKKYGGSLNKFQDGGDDIDDVLEDDSNNNIIGTYYELPEVDVIELDLPIYATPQGFYERNKDLQTYFSEKDINSGIADGNSNIIPIVGNNPILIKKDFSDEAGFSSWNNYDYHPEYTYCTPEGCTARANRFISSLFTSGSQYFQNPDKTKEYFGATFSADRPPTSDEIKRYPYAEGDTRFASLDAWDQVDAAQRNMPNNVLYSNIYVPKNGKITESDINKVAEKNIPAGEIWKKYKIPIGSIINVGLSPGNIAEGFLSKRNIVAGTHTIRVVGYTDTGEPLVADYGQIRPLSQNMYGPEAYVAGIITVPGNEEFTYDHFVEKSKLRNKPAEDPDYYLKDILESENVESNPLKIFSDKKYSKEFVDFNNSIINEENRLRSKLNISKEKYDQYAKIALTIAGTETEFGKGIFYKLFDYGDSTGITQLNKKNVEGKYEETLKSYKKGTPEYDAVSTILYIKELDKYKKEWSQKGSKAQERPFRMKEGYSIKAQAKKAVRNIQSKPSYGYEQSDSELLPDTFTDEKGVVELPFKQPWQSEEDFTKEVNDALKEAGREDLRFAFEDGKRTIFRTTLGNTIPDTLEDMVFYSWQSPSSYIYGDAQGKSDYYIKAKTIYRELFPTKKKYGGVLPKAQPGLQTQNPNEVKYGTPEYERAYNQGTLVTRLSGDAEDAPLRTRMLPEFTFEAFKESGQNVFENYPYFNTLTEEEKKYFRDTSPIGRNVRRIASRGREGFTDEVNQFATGLLYKTPLSVFQIPQSAIVEGVQGLRGKDASLKRVFDPNLQRVPSDVWGFENKPGFGWEDVGNFGMDMSADPLNLVGAGLLKSPIKAVLRETLDPTGLLRMSGKGLKQAGRYAKTRTPFSTINTNSKHPSTLSLNQRVEVAKSLDRMMRTKGMEDVRALNSPEGRRRLYNLFKETYPNLTEKELNTLVFNRIQDVLHSIRNNPGTRGLEELGLGHPEIFYDPNFSYYFPHNNAHYHPLENYVTLGEKYVDHTPTLHHEDGHAIQQGEVTALDDKFRNILSTNLYGNKKFSFKGVLDDFYRFLNSREYSKGNIYKNRLLKHTGYFYKGSDGLEPLPFGRELRQWMLENGIIKSRWENITPAKLKEAKKIAGKAGNLDDGNRLLYIIPPWDFGKLAKPMNELPALAPYIGTGAAGTYGINQLMNQQPESYKRGGSLPKAQNGEDLFPGEGMYYQIPEYTFDYKRRFSDLPTPRYTGPLMSQQLIDEATQREYEQRIRAIDESIAARRNPFSAERLAKESATTGDKLSLQMMFGDPYNSPRVYEALGALDFINPAVMLGDMATGLGALPYNIQEGNYGSAALGLVSPLATGALASIGVKSPRGFINNLVNPFAGIGDTPRQIPGSPKAVSVVDDVSRVVADTPQPWQMQELPGLHLKSTMSGSPLEKQLSKTGEISKKNIIAHINKAETSAADKFTLQKVLDQKFPNQNKIDYNDFRKAVSDEAIELERKVVADYEYNDWGLDRLGYPNAKRSNYDFAIKLLQDTIQELERKLSGAIEPTSWQTSDQIRKNLEMQLIGEKAQLANKLSEYEKLPLENVSVTYGNPTKFGRGNAKHFEEHTLGHARTLVSPEEPHIMHFLEQQSDWAQNLEKTKPINLEKYQEKLTRQEARYLEDLETLKKLKETKMDYLGNPKSDWEIAQFEDIINKKGAELNIRKGDIFNPQQKEFLGKAHQERLLQENVKYAAEQGKSSVRFPTPETAAKVQGYSKIDPVTDPIEISKIKEEIAEIEELLKDNPTPSVEKLLNEGLTRYKLNLSGGYSPKHQTILKKYSEQPKTIKKLFGKEPTIVTDSKGNTWYEFDIPEKFKQGKGEIKAYQRGGSKLNPYGMIRTYPGESGTGVHGDVGLSYDLPTGTSPYLSNQFAFEPGYGSFINPGFGIEQSVGDRGSAYIGANMFDNRPMINAGIKYRFDDGGPLQTDPVLNFITQQQPRRFSKSKK